MLAVGLAHGVLSMRKAPKPARSGTALFPELSFEIWRQGASETMTSTMDSQMKSMLAMGMSDGVLTVRGASKPARSGIRLLHLM